MKKTLLLSPQPKKSYSDDQAPVTHTSTQERARGRELAGDSSWLSRKMIDDGCSLEQTLHVIDERCKGCDGASPIFCIDQCETWKVKRELRKVKSVLSEDNHRLKLFNAIKNKRRLTILDVLCSAASSIDSLQTKLKKYRFHHSQKTINQYLKPLLKAGLVQRSGKRFGPTLYGRKVHGAIVRHGFSGELPTNSDGYEEKTLTNLLDGAKTRSQLLKVAPAENLSRTLKRLRERDLISNNPAGDRVFYFRTKRPLSLEHLSPTQKRICRAIPQAGISARPLSKAVGINLRRTYKYLRGLRGKKLVFRRIEPLGYELARRGRAIAEFLEEIATIR